MTLSVFNDVVRANFPCVPLGGIWATFLNSGVVVGRPRWTLQAQRQDRKLSKLHKNTAHPIGACSQNPERQPRRPIRQRLLVNVVRSRSQMRPRCVVFRHAQLKGGIIFFKHIFDHCNFCMFLIQLFDIIIFTFKFVWTRALQRFITKEISTWV